MRERRYGRRHKRLSFSPPASRLRTSLFIIDGYDKKRNRSFSLDALNTF
jgi:hypothetical protein